MPKHESRAMPFTGYVIDERTVCPWCAWALAKGQPVVMEKHEDHDEDRCTYCGNQMTALGAAEPRKHGGDHRRRAS